MANIYNHSTFLGTIAGRQDYVSFNGGQTYARILDDKVLASDCVRDLRKRIPLINSITAHEEHRRIGNQYNYPWGGTPSTMPGGGYFKIIELANKKNQKFLSNHQYSLEKIGDPLEKLANMPMRQIQHQCDEYGMSYFINRFFDGVAKPEEGNLVVYYDQADRAVHSGIFRSSARNWNSPEGGTVESMWSSGTWETSSAFQHDFFFIPTEFGTIAKFYQVKKTLPPPKILPQHNLPTGPMHKKMDDGTFRYVANEANETIRTTIDKTRSDLPSLFPQMECIRDQQFAGRCHKYAMDKILHVNYSKWMPPWVEGDLLGVHKSELLEKYFTPISDPENGDLAVYLDPFGKRVHFGVYIAEDLIESKWGRGNIYKHPPFYVDHSYGNTIIYYRFRDPDTLGPVERKSAQPLDSAQQQESNL